MRHASKTRALLAALVAGFVAASCSGDKTVTAPRSALPTMANSIGVGAGPVSSTTSQLIDGLMTCSPLPRASASKVIGPAGGVLNIGPYVLRIPAGALAQSVLISGDAPSGSVNSVRFSPEGLQFAQPAELTMTDANCGEVVGLVPRIAYTNELLQILEFIPSVADLQGKQVTGYVSHFSRYAVSW